MKSGRLGCVGVPGFDLKSKIVVEKWINFPMEWLLDIFTWRSKIQSMKRNSTQFSMMCSSKLLQHSCVEKHKFTLFFFFFLFNEKALHGDQTMSSRTNRHLYNVCITMYIADMCTVYGILRLAYQLFYWFMHTWTWTRFTCCFSFEKSSNSNICHSRKNEKCWIKNCKHRRRELFNLYNIHISVSSQKKKKKKNDKI